MDPSSEQVDFLKLSSYNVRGLPKDCRGLHLRPDILEFLTNSDILCVQETWYCKQDLAGLNCLHNNYHGWGTTTVDYRDGLVAGHPPGGVAILWHSRLDSHIKPVDINCSFAAAIEVNLGSKKFFVVNVYLPYQCPANEELYVDCLGALESAIEEFGSTCFVVLGDWNANPGDAENSLFARHMNNFCLDNSFIISSQVVLPDDSYTYISSAWETCSWLDHAVSSSDFHNSIHEMCVHYNISDEDHIPFTMWLSTDRIPNITDATNKMDSNSCKWSHLTEEVIAKYTEMTDQLLQDIIIGSDLRCTNVNCTDVSHIDAANKLYSDLIGCLKKAELAVFTRSSQKAKYNKPGWSDHVQELYQCSRHAYMVWCDAGKPRHGHLYERHKDAKVKYKYARRFISRNENALRKEALANKLCNLDQREFWKEIKLINNCKTPLPASVSDAVGEHQIADLWKRHFDTLFNCVTPMNSPSSRFDDVSSFNDVCVNYEELKTAIRDLPYGKACGLDGIFSEHLKYASSRLLIVLCVCLTSLFTHGALPDSLIDVILVPVIKDKSGNITSRENYRPIALAGVVSKVIELILLNRIYEFLLTTPNQFGFKRKHGTDQCIYVLKECINSYKALNSSVFTCFLDASKAFDRVNHGALFDKLLRRGVPVYIVRLLMFWYAHQRVCVKWGNTLSEFFTVCNGVRQGGILSPLLFNVYMNDLSTCLNTHNIGCAISGITINHLMYADDLVLLAPSLSGLQKLIKECEDYGRAHDVKFNAKKSALVYFITSFLRKITLPSLYLNGCTLSVVKSVKYLGHLLSSDFSDDDDINRQCRDIYTQGNILLRKFFMCTIDVKCKMFKTYCTPLYTAHLWIHYRRATINKLYIAYHNIFKLMMGFCKYDSTSLLCTVFDVPSCSSVIRKFIYRFCIRLESSSNPLIVSFLASGVYYQSSLRKHWLALLM
jgi:exonuclease III